MIYNINKAVVATMMILVALASVDKAAVSADTATHLRRRAKSAKDGPPPSTPRGYYSSKNSKKDDPPPSPPRGYYSSKNSKKNPPTTTLMPVTSPTPAPTGVPTAPTDAPTGARADPPTDPPTEAPTVAPTTAEPTKAPTEAPTTAAPTKAPREAPTVAPTDSFTLSPIASTSSVVTGVAAPGSPNPEERKLSEDILTVADFVQTLDAEMDSLLGVPESSSCIVESSAIQYGASDSECTEAFTADQLVGASFCYSFQTTISPPTSGEDCDVNAAAQLVTTTLEEGGFADAIGAAADIVGQEAPTDAPTDAPTGAPTGAPTTEPTSGATTAEPTSGATTAGPTSGTTTAGPTSGTTTEEPTGGTTTTGPTFSV